MTKSPPVFPQGRAWRTRPGKSPQSLMMLRSYILPGGSHMCLLSSREAFVMGRNLRSSLQTFRDLYTRTRRRTE